MVFETLLNKIFGPLTAYPDAYAISAVAVIVALIFTLFHKAMVNKNEMRHVKMELEKIKKRMNKAKKERKEKEINMLLAQSMQLSQKQLKMMLKPLFFSLILIVFIFQWLKSTYNGVTIALPFNLPFIGDSVGWLGAYIIMSIPATIILRKLLDVE